MFYRREGGFTLVELSIVVLVLGVIASIAIISVSEASSSFKRSSILSQLRFSLSKAKDRVNAEGIPYRVVYHKDFLGVGPCYEYQRKEDGVWVSANIPTGSEVSREVEGRYLIPFLENKVVFEFQGDQTEVSFLPKGVMIIVEPRTIPLKVVGRNYTLVVDQFGKVDISE